MVIVSDQFHSSEVTAFLTALAEDVDTDNFDETRNNIAIKTGKGKSKGGAQ
jgi:hypothetical protein